MHSRTRLALTIAYEKRFCLLHCLLHHYISNIFSGYKRVPNPGLTQHRVAPLQDFWALLHVIYATSGGESYDNYGIDYALQHGGLKICPKSTQYPINHPLQPRYTTNDLMTVRRPQPMRPSTSLDLPLDLPLNMPPEPLPIPCNEKGLNLVYGAN